MAKLDDKSTLKRARVRQQHKTTHGDTGADYTMLQGSTTDDAETKKPRRSARLSNAGDEATVEIPSTAEALKNSQLPSPMTAGDSKGKTVSPPADREGRERRQATPRSSPPPSSRRNGGLSSPPADTQPYSQFLQPPPVSYEVENEEEEGVWGYLVPTAGVEDPLVLRKRAACPVSLGVEHQKLQTSKTSKKEEFLEQEEQYEDKKAINGVPAGGYLVGRHPECDRKIHSPVVSNRHCLVFAENKNGSSIAMLEDLSNNGTYVNDALVGRNKRRELEDGDEISILDEARFIFRYPRIRDTNGFRQQYSIHGQLGKGHFATVYLALEKSSGIRYAVKKFEKRSGPGERSKVDGLQQEIAVLMGVSHPNMLCLKDTFDESDGVYLVLELAPEGELFNWIVMKQKLTEAETRKIFVQLFQGVKYLVSRFCDLPFSKYILTHASTSATLSTATSSQKTSYSPTRISTSSWPILVWRRLSAKSLSPPHSAAHHPMWHRRFSSKRTEEDTPEQWMSGVWV